MKRSRLRQSVWVGLLCSPLVAAAAGSGGDIDAPDAPRLTRLRLAAALGQTQTIEPANEPPRAHPTSAASLDTLAGVIARVWRDNPEVLQAQQALKASGYDVTTARSGHFPYLQVQSALGQTSEESVSTLYVILPIWQGGRTKAQVDTAKAKQRLAMAELARVRMDLGQRTLEAFLNVAAAQDQQVQWSNYVAALKRLQGTINRRAESGLAPQADVETVVSRLRQAEANIQSSRAQLMTNRAQLASLLGAVPGSVQWPDDAHLLTDEEVAAYRLNVERNPMHLAARAEVDLQIGTAAIAKAALWPEFSLQHRRQLEGSEFDPSNDATLVVMSFQSNNGLAGYLGYRAERQRIDAFKARLEAIGRQVEATLDADRAQLEATAAQLNVQYEAVRATTALVGSFLRQFEAGRKTWLEVLNAQREANDIVLQSIAVRRNYWLANAKLALDSMQWHRLAPNVVIAPASGE